MTEVNSLKLNLKLALILIALIAINVFSSVQETEAVSSSVEFIVDFSESMNEMIGNKSKIETAREAVIKILDKIPESLDVGLSFYGHRDKDKCDDIEQVVPVKGLNRRQIKEKLKGTEPLGRAPVALALKKAVERLKGNNHFLSIILVTDGKTTCEGDFLKTTREIKERYDYRVIIHVIRVNSSNKGRAQLLRVAYAGYGLFKNIKSKKNIGKAIKSISDEVYNFKMYHPRVVNFDDMALIPAGKFLMGSAHGENPDKQPGRLVYLDAFYLDRYEITQKQYKTVMGENPSLWIGSDLPVESMSWFDAKKYCEKIGKRLLTEAEWEKAAKSGRADRWAGTSVLEKLGEYAWLDDINIGPSRSGGRTNPAGLKKPNGYGIYDMSGNVMEWVADWHDGYPYKINTEAPDAGVARVLKGGSWDNHWLGARTTKRFANRPDVRFSTNGFRCAKSAE